MAVAKAQYAISEITAMLRSKGINVRVRLCFKRLLKIVLHNMYDSSLPSIQLQVACQDNAMFFSRKHQCLMIVSQMFIRADRGNRM